LTCPWQRGQLTKLRDLLGDGDLSPS